LPRLKLFLLFFIISKCFLPAGNAQTAISGIINSYSEVTSVVDADDIIISNPSDFYAGDTVLLIQVKGIGINVNDTSTQFGLSQNVYGAGKYEFLLINTINQGTGEVNFTSDMGNFGDYDAGGSLQLVRVPGYDNARVTGTLTCEPWDSTAGTGGVLAMIVGNTLTLETDIDVTGKGLKGGKASFGTEECSDDNPSRYDHIFFHKDSLTAGYKGEGAASYALFNTTPLGMAYKKGRGPLFNGGGGGNGKYSGGGGGANYGSGGAGGFESESCPGGPYAIGGIGGRDVTSLPDLESGKRIFMGGGGGSATQQNPGDATDGGNGGGIIIIVADTLIGNGKNIKANGADVTDIANENGGAGGGGGGGTILLEVNGFKGSNLNVEMNGGKGGDSDAISGSCTGPGGGGGGGAFWHSIATLPPEVTIDVSGGAEGSSNYFLFVYGMVEGEPGGIISGLKVPLSGFLFNSIYSFFTGADHDTICENEIPPKFLGTAPKGGTPSYEFRWEYSTDQAIWNVEVDWSDDSRQNHLPSTPLIDTTYYRRLVRDQSVPQILDISKILTIIVQPKIEQNSFSFDTTICFGQVPNPIAPEFPSPIGGDGTYTYYWQKSIDNIDFDPADGVNNTAIYSPPALTDTTYFRRTVYSGKCQRTSDTVTITVLPLIADNAITDNQIICEGSVFNQLDGSVPTGGEGAGTYTYKWIESTNASTWLNAFGPDFNKDYSPDTTSTGFPGTLYFRRVVYSGLANCCTDTSNQVTLTDWPKLENNLIMTNQVICEGDNPDTIAGTSPAGGDGSNYLFQWQQLNGTWNDILGETAKDYDSGILTDTTLYRRIVTSDVCKDTSNVDTIPVNPAILNYNIQTLSGATDTTICSGQIPNSITSEFASPVGGNGIYNYLWEKSINGVDFSTADGVNDVAVYSPPTLTDTTYFRRTVYSGQCQEVSDTITINVLPLISDNVITPAASSVCYNSNISLTTIDPSGGDGSYTYYWEESPDNSTWGPASSTNDQRDYTSPPLTSEVYYRRTIISGPLDCCQDISATVLIGIYPLPSAGIDALDTTVCSGSPVDLTFRVVGANGPWDLTYTDGTTPVTVSIPNSTAFIEPITRVTDLESVSYLYTIDSLIDAKGCIAPLAYLTGQAKITLNGIPVADAGVDDEVCGLTYTLQAVAGSFGTGQWTFPAVVTDASGDTNPNKVVQVNAEGTYTFTWVVTNGVCAPVSDDVQIIFWEQPDVADAGPDQDLDPGKTETYLEGNLPIVGTGLWTKYHADAPVVIADPNDPSTEVSNLAIGDNKFIWTISNGICPVESDEVFITVNIIVPPNVFTPNNDGINDFYVIPGVENRKNELIVVNRLGTKVFGAENYQNDWDGKYKGEDLPEDVYYYVLYIYWDDGVEKISGYIVIKRQ